MTTDTTPENYGHGLHMDGQDSLVQPLLTDFYQVTMCYGYWKAGVADQSAVFDLFFRRNPFQGEFTIFAGLADCLRFLHNFRYSQSDVDFLRHILPDTTESAFFDYLAGLNCSAIIVRAIPEGSVVFPRVPLVSIEGPLAICQLLETTFLNLINYASLIATNAARFRQAAGDRIELLEFGLRRAQGPNGGLTASKYSYVGGFDATSNVLAGKLYGIPVKGTQAHSFVCSFSCKEDLLERRLKANGETMEVDLVDLAQEKLDLLMEKINWGVSSSEVSIGERVAFAAYAIAFPNGFLALVDTYDVLRLRLHEDFGLALHELGYKARGVRIDSGDLAYLSKEIRVQLKKVAAIDPKLSWFAECTIVASNDINEETITSLNEQKHEIDSFGVGTHLVTCQKQPALGCVFKLVAITGQPKIKLSQEVVKITIPGKKRCYRMFGKTGHCILDLMTLDDEEEPESNVPILCRHPFEESKRALVMASRVERLHIECWSQGELRVNLPGLLTIKQRVNQSLETLRKDHRRNLNPTPYKVSVSEKLYTFLHSLWLLHAPVGQLE